MPQHESNLIPLLLGRRTSRVAEMEREGVVPPYLAAKYARESAAHEAASLPRLPPMLAAALLHASLLDEEEDVRAAARHALILHGGALGDAAYCTLLLDADADVRSSAFDEALEIMDDARRANLIRQAVDALAGDDAEFVRLRALEFRNALVAVPTAIKRP